MAEEAGEAWVLAALVRWGSGEFPNLWLFSALECVFPLLSSSSQSPLNTWSLPRETRRKFKEDHLVGTYPFSFLETVQELRTPQRLQKGALF